MAIGKHWPLVAALAVLYAVLGACLVLSLRQNDGHFIYVLDDPYIHMAVAKNLTEHGVAGVTRHGFSSSTSSIGWPLLLALTYLVLGTHAVAPLVWNVLCATAVVGTVYLLLNRQGVPPRLNFLYLLVISFCTPLPAIVFTGLEHTLHVLLAVAFLYLAAKFLSQQPGGRSESPGATRAFYFALPPLITMTRYEGALMIAVVCLLLAIRRRLREAAVLGVLGAVPVVVSGLVAVSKGWLFLPNPVLLKGRVPPGSSFDQVLAWLRSTALTLISQPHVPALIVATGLVLFVLYRKDRRFWTPGKTMIWIFLLTVLLHVQLAKIGWFFRYEAYLVACGLVAIFLATGEHLIEYFQTAVTWKRVALGFAVGMLALPLARHGGRSLVLIPPASTLIYEQQYQMAAFLKQYYTGRAVAANDIGAINFYADVRSLDLWGLASLEVADARLNHRYGPEEIRSIAAARDVKVALVYDRWFEEQHGGLPPQWQPVGEWEITAISGKRNLVVSFYAVDAGEKDALAGHLREFSSRLPERVVQRGLYTQLDPLPARMAARPNGDRR